jgi:hypothetical protein
MGTSDPQVFAAGDGAFGGSTIVMAMHHGHRAAYYMQAFLDGRADPVPYRTPFRTRRVAIAQDSQWEVFPRHDQAFHGLGHDPKAFPEIESTYDDPSAKAEAARCYRCDAETGSSDYNVRTREDIFVMARANPRDARTHQAILKKRLEPRDDPFGPGHKASLEDLVFLPANLSRLVIDPYRDACNVASRLAGRVALSLPFVVTGFDDVPSEIFDAAQQAARAAGTAYLGRRKPANDVPWLQLVRPGEDKPDAAAEIVIHAPKGAFRPFKPERARPEQGLGLVATAADLESAIPFALDAKLDLLVLDSSGTTAGGWPELTGHPDLTVLRDALRILRRLNREEDIGILFAGGVRSGTDGAKLLALGANAVAVGASMAFALGGHVEGGAFHFYSDLTAAERDDRGASFLKALSAESSIMARCTGKTDVHNLEPEDLRAISVATAEATGIPLAGVQYARGHTALHAAE